MMIAAAAGVAATLIAVVVLVLLVMSDNGGGGRNVAITGPETSGNSAFEVRERTSDRSRGPARQLPRVQPAPAKTEGRPKQHDAQQSEAATPSQAGADPVQSALGSVALVRCGAGHGSGFMAAPNLLVTNHHVIASARLADLRVRFPDHPNLRDKEFSASLVTEDPGADLAVLSVECGVAALPVPRSYVHTNGQRVVAIGSPGTGGNGGALQNLTTDGRLGPPYKLANGDERWALAMAINPGNSGGPVLDAATGQVMAVIVAKFTKTESQSLAVPHGLLVDVLARAQRCSPRDREQAESLHRQRYCLGHMVRMLALADGSFRKSCAAALESTDETASGRLEAFNDFKAMASRVLSDEFTVFETVVSSEVDRISADNACDPVVRAGITKLRKSIDEQAANLRRSVPLHEIDAFLREVGNSLERSRSLASGVAKSLAMESIIEEAEDDE
jgi:S1-C subfamily serine protease